MKSALLGYTGFVGGNLFRQTSFDDVYNSQNIAEIKNKTYDLVVCAAAPGVKWLANQKPAEDWKSISALMAHLKTVRAQQFVLISTVDVYPQPIAVDEKTIINPEVNSPYGKHRFLLEQFVVRTFPHHLIVRLPGLFGEGLKKNILYDFIHNQLMDKINPDSQFQFYNLKYLWNDIQTAIAAKSSLINLVTEPIKAGEIYKAAFKKAWPGGAKTQPVIYDVQSIQAALYGGQRYQFTKKAVLPEITQFITTHRRTV